jgi:transposase
MKTTSQIDARKVYQKTLQYLRDRAISLKNDGKNNREIAKLLGIAEETVSRWYSAYKKAGDEALRVKKCKFLSNPDTISENIRTL